MADAESSKMAVPEPLPKQLSFFMTPDVSKRMENLQDLIRKAGHHRPSQKVLVESLIWMAVEDGRKLELEVIAPYRQDHEEAED